MSVWPCVSFVKISSPVFSEPSVRFGKRRSGTMKARGRANEMLPSRKGEETKERERERVFTQWPGGIGHGRFPLRFPSGIASVLSTNDDRMQRTERRLSVPGREDRKNSKLKRRVGSRRPSCSRLFRVAAFGSNRQGVWAIRFIFGSSFRPTASQSAIALSGGQYIYCEQRRRNSSNARQLVHLHPPLRDRQPLSSNVVFSVGIFGNSI